MPRGILYRPVGLFGPASNPLSSEISPSGESSQRDNDPI